MLNCSAAGISSPIQLIESRHDIAASTSRKVKSCASALDDDDDDAEESAVKSPSNSALLAGAKDWLVSSLIGFLVVSYWRGTWTLFDIWLCQQPVDARLVDGTTFCWAGLPAEYGPIRRESGYISLVIGFVCTALGVSLMWAGLWRPNVALENLDDKITITKRTAILRVAIVYVLGMAAVHLWRGIWYLTDFYLLPNTLTANEWGEWPVISFWVSSIVGSTGCFLLFSGPSLLAPPATFFLDGPGVNPPPIAITMVSSYYSLTLPAGKAPPELSTFHKILDVLVSFVAVPFVVVLYWRGSWLLLDFYLWNFSFEPDDLHKSMGLSCLIGVLLLALTSETSVASVKIQDETLLAVFGRFRTYVMAWGTVNFWRVVWYIWDEFLGGTTQWSCWISHIGSIVCLTAMGCLSCIVAPPSTIGVDFTPTEHCADEPLFSNLPAPAEDLHYFGIGRQLPTFATDDTVVDLEAEGDLGVIHEDSSEDSGELEMTTTPPVRNTGVGSPRASLAGRRWSVVTGESVHRASYSSVRRISDPDPYRGSYFERMRPDLDRRRASAEGSNELVIRRRSSLYRSR